ncbi:hypothetical protein HY485_03230 [Candidatus Woesearchaeota archaeon]|nr:hypothetical protein [Candidatus Woesearchaeota archaeon]
MVAYEQSEWFEHNVYRSVHFPKSLDDKLRKIAVREQKSVGQVVRDALQSQVNSYEPTNKTFDDINKSKTIVLRTIYIPRTLDEELRRFAFRAEKPKCDVIIELVRAELKKYDKAWKYNQ